MTHQVGIYQIGSRLPGAGPRRRVLSDQVCMFPWGEGGVSCGADLGRMNLGRGGGGVVVAMVLKYTSLFQPSEPSDGGIGCTYK